MSTQNLSYHQGALLVAAAGVCYGLQAVFARFAYQDGADPITVLFGRFFLASIVIILFLKHKGVRISSTNSVMGVASLGVLVTITNFFYYSALDTISASLTVILFFLFPTLTTLIALLFFRESLNLRKVLALMLAFTGVVLASNGRFDGDSTGVLFGLLAALTYAIYIAYGTYRVKHQNAMLSATIILVVCNFIYGVVGLWFGFSWPESYIGWLALFGVAIISTVLPMIMFWAGSPVVGASDAATLSTLEAVVTIILATLLLHEPLHLHIVLGAIAVLSAVIILTYKRSGKRPAPEAEI